MKLLSGIIGSFILLLAVVFALSNRQPATVAFWPFGFDLSAPLCFLLLAALLGGALLGAAFVTASLLPTCRETRRLRREIAKQRERNAQLEARCDEVASSRREEKRNPQAALPGLPERHDSSRFLRNHIFSWGPR